MKTKTQQKIYKVTYGSTTIQTKRSGKFLLNKDGFNVESIKVIATDVYDALEKTAKNLLDVEKDWLEEDEQIFVESVQMLAFADDLEQPKN